MQRIATMARTRLNILIDEGLKRRMYELAREQNRNLSNWVETVLKKEVESAEHARSPMKANQGAD